MKALVSLTVMDSWILRQLHTGPARALHVDGLQSILVGNVMSPGGIAFLDVNTLINMPYGQRRFQFNQIAAQLNVAHQSNSSTATWQI